MRPHLPLALAAVLAAGCASFEMPRLPSLPQLGSPPTSPMASVREFADIPVPSRLIYQHTRSTIIESPVSSSARLVYMGTIAAEELRVQMRAGLEANGWRHVNSATSPELGSIQLYEKEGSSLQVIVREGTAPYTELHLIASRAAAAARSQVMPTATGTR
jgi:hypothetical protein